MTKKGPKGIGCLREINFSAIAPPPILQQQGQVSAAELIIDNDGIVRRSFWGAELEPNNPILGLGLYTALEFLNASPNVPYPEAVQSLALSA